MSGLVNRQFMPVSEFGPRRNVYEVDRRKPDPAYLKMTTRPGRQGKRPNGRPPK